MKNESTALRIRTTQLIYRFDMNTTFDLSDLSRASTKAPSNAVGSLEAPIRRPSMVFIFRFSGLDVL